MLDYKKLAESKKDDLLRDLVELIAINSTRDMTKSTKETPVGPGPVVALKKFLSYAERDGFNVKNVDNYAGRVDFGEGEERLGIAVHVDTVPAGDGWKLDPYKAIIKNGKVYGRGSGDNKGPALAAYYAMLILKENGFKPKKKIDFIIGTDEETDWIGMKYYLKKEPAPDIVFSPDSGFPIVNGQSGLAVLNTRFTGKDIEGKVVLQSFFSGLANNMIPSSAKCEISGNNLDEVSERYSKYLKENGLVGDAEIKNESLKLTLEGVASHASIPWKGKNAATYLARFLKDLDFAGRDKDYLNFVGEVEFEDFYGEKLGIANEDPDLGRSVNCAGVFRYQRGGEALIKSDIRYSRGTSPEKMSSQLNEKFGEICRTTYQPYEDFEKPHYVSKDDPFVKTLLRVYEKQTGKKGHEVISAGANYGRFFKRGVGFGPTPEGAPSTAHAIDEYINISELIDGIAIYAEVIYELTK